MMQVKDAMGDLTGFNDFKGMNINTRKTQNPHDVCRDFMHHRCDKGSACRFVHDSDLCFHWWKHGSCKYGDQCKKNHYVSPVQKGDTEETPQTTTIHQPHKRNHRPIRNTECFEPMTKPVDMRIVFDCGTWVDNCSTDLTSRDVLVVPNLFADFAPGEVYKMIVDEIISCGIHPDKLLKLWHGNDKIEGTHLIADDKTNWKELCPTFDMVINRIKSFFDMNIQATRFNWYVDTSQWKPFHHDAAAVKPEKAAVQNFTVAVSFGATRDAAFEHAKTKTVISLPQPDGYVYAFSKDTNIIWRHGILQDMPKRDIGRVSVICWGYIEGMKDI
jgi:hypothetical protein